MNNKRKGSVSFFFIGLMLLGLIMAVLIWMTFASTAQTLAPSGKTFQIVGCKINNAMASYGVLKDFGIHLPKIFCKPFKEDINANDCDCRDFDAYMDSTHPLSNLYDDDVSEYASIFAEGGKTRIEFDAKHVFDYKLRTAEIYINTSLPNPPLEIDIKIKESMWSRWKNCNSKTFRTPSDGWHDLLDHSDCEVPSESKIAIIFDTSKSDGKSIEISELNLTFEDDIGTVEPMEDILNLPPSKAEESLVRYSYFCNKNMENGECSEKWKRNWVALQLSKLAASCWSMGLENTGQPGAFPCFGGKIIGLEDSLGADGSEVIHLVANSSTMAQINDNITYEDYLPASKLNHQCPDLTPYFENIRTYSPWMLPAFLNHPISSGYKPGSRYFISYADMHIMTASYNLGVYGSDKIIFC